MSDDDTPSSPYDRTLWPAKSDHAYDLPRYNIFPHMRAEGVLLLIAPPKTGKSFAALEAAWSIASKKPFMGIHPVDVSGPVLYVAGEGAEETSGRIMAKHKGGERIPRGLALYSFPIDLKDLPELGRFVEWARGREFAAIVFDTVARCGGGKEDAEDLTKLVNGVTYVNQELGCSIILLHHSPKSSKTESRGHTSLPAAVDAQWILEKDDGVYSIIPSFSRTNLDSEEPIACFRIENVVLGVNEDGREVGYGRAVPCPVPERRAKKRETRAEKARRMRDGGMSMRAIAAALKVSPATIVSDLKSV